MSTQTTSIAPNPDVLPETPNVRVIFDNGGGITLQLPGWAHWYPGNVSHGAPEAARDFRAYEKTHNVSGWGGHEDDSADLEPTDDEIRNGGYRIMRLPDIIMAVYGDDEAGRSQYWGAAQLAFVNALRIMADREPLTAE